MNADDRNNDGDGYDPHIVLGECREVFKGLKASEDRIELALWGKEGTTGLVRDVGDLKRSWIMISAFLGLIASIIGSLITAFIISKTI